MRSTLVLALALVIGMVASVASAATYKVHSIINDNYDGFRSSLIHSQRYDGDMSGSWVAGFYSGVKDGGTWAHNGDLNFAGKIYTYSSKYYYKASGNIDKSGGGYLNFVFKNMYKTIEKTFYFDGNLAMGPANSYKDGVISLWGDTRSCQTGHCLGMDLRVKVSAVPLPASLGFLAFGAAGLFGLRRFKKAQTA